MKLSDRKAAEMVANMELQRKKAADAWTKSRSALVKHFNTKNNELTKPAANKIVKKGNEFVQYWEFLPEFMNDYAPSKECPKEIYRQLREPLCVDPTYLSHHTMTDLLKRYKNSLPDKFVEVIAYIQAIIEALEKLVGKSHYRKKVLHSRASCCLTKTDKVQALVVAKDYESLLDAPAEAHMIGRMISIKKSLNNGKQVAPVHTWRSHDFEDIYTRAKFFSGPRNGNRNNKNKNGGNRNRNNKNGQSNKQNNKPKENDKPKQNTNQQSKSEIPEKPKVRFADDMRNELLTQISKL